MSERLAALQLLSFEALVERAVRNHQLMLKVKPDLPSADRSMFAYRSPERLIEIVARQERILIHEGLLPKNAARVVTPT